MSKEGTQDSPDQKKFVEHFGGLEYGPVIVRSGEFAGRIGYYDDEDDDNDAIVYFGNGMLTTPSYSTIPHEYLDIPTVEDIMKREEELHKFVSPLFPASKKLSQKKKMQYMVELSFVQNLAHQDWVRAIVNAQKTSQGKRIFISHSSKDKWFARKIGTDLAKWNFAVWLDEWTIKPGRSIPKEIQEGISESAFVVVILTPNAVDSRWVEVEWQAKYWDEISKGHVMVIPVLLEECEIPALLKAKKYVDFKSDYNDGMKDLLWAFES